MLQKFQAFLQRQKTPPPPFITPEKELLKKNYQRLMLNKQFKTNLAQIAVLANLQRLLDQIVEENNNPNRVKPSSINSVYIFGEVGQGKSLLMKLFFSHCPINQKRHIHFHDFMLEVHAFVHQWRQQHDNDPFLAFAKSLRQSTWLLCFDEFNVTDIADAMILTRLFQHLLTEGIIFVATSNQHPDDLYKGGLQYELFLPFIKRLKQQAKILELIAQTDYRLINNTAADAFHIGLNTQATTFLSQHFTDLAKGKKAKPYSLKLQGREVHFEAAMETVLISSFQELCCRTLGSADYIALSKCFTTIFIRDIPQLSIECRDNARRFVTLIDALYERQVLLVCTLAVPVESLYEADGIFEFKRTQSRLIEMQSSDYRKKQLILNLRPPIPL
ncbi:MAG: AFG1 family ATPase [Methylococcales bacterium]|nr:AFG1 family ATPase [Methylococcales bacterium]